MEIIIKFSNGKTNKGIFSSQINIDKLSIDFLYTEFQTQYETIYKEYINQDDIIIIFEKYPIRNFKLKSLKSLFEERELEGWLEFDVYLKDDWFNLTKITNLKKGKRKLDSKNNNILEPKKKKRKIK